MTGYLVRRMGQMGLTLFLIVTVTFFLEVWPESHRPGLALRQAGVFQSYMAQ